APRPFLDSDIQLIRDLFDEELTEKILYRNACNFYSKSEPLT
ncbi:TPA: 2-pyrone-4,6-dicarboxylate hydrolase, partial [Legionella pneumophila]|nr:2-pyrone-4,6-dicarboxylate hydrolase [Legionella pneumophila]